MPGNMQAMMQQAQKMQQKMQEEIAHLGVVRKDDRVDDTVKLPAA